MSDTAITIRGLGKLYRLGLISSGTLHGDLSRWWARVRHREDPNSRVGQTSLSGRGGDQYIWALRDVDLDVVQGEVLGVIGGNGAGKSTLLKILSRVTAPTVGEAQMHGRVGSLLEIGTGFHPELTGRENIFLNGAILGMGRAEIRSRMDEIVAFAEIEEYLDTPVKRYSSGMYVRLAFAVAAHLNLEVLLVDEVLAVGDVQFQTKCLGRLSSIAHEGRTVLFVSHNMGAVARLCTSAVLIRNGSVAYRGKVDEAVSMYLATENASGDSDLTAVSDRSGNGRARFVRAVTRDSLGNVCDAFSIGDDLHFHLTMVFAEPIREARMSLQIISASGIPIYHLVAVDSAFEFTDLEGEVTVRVTLPKQKLYPGEYHVSLWLADSSYEALDRVPQAFKFMVSGGGTVVVRELDRSSAVVHELAVWERLK